MFVDGLNVPIFAAVNYSNIYDKIKLFKELNLFFEIYLDADALSSINIEQLKELNSAINSNKMLATVHSPFWDLSLGSSDPEIRKLSVMRIITSLNAAKTLNAQNVVFHSGYNDTAFLPRGKNEWIKNMIDSIGSILEYSESFGLNISLENTYEPDPEILLSAVSAFPKKLKLCLDIGHYKAFGKASIEEWIDSTAPYLKEIHLHSNFGGTDSHLALDDGNIDFEKCFERLIVKKANPIVTIENKNDGYLARSVKLLKSERYFRMLNNFKNDFNR